MDLCLTPCVRPDPAWNPQATFATSIRGMMPSSSPKTASVSLIEGLLGPERSSPTAYIPPAYPSPISQFSVALNFGIVAYRRLEGRPARSWAGVGRSFGACRTMNGGRLSGTTQAGGMLPTDLLILLPGQASSLKPCGERSLPHARSKSGSHLGSRYQPSRAKMTSALPRMPWCPRLARPSLLRVLYRPS